MKFSNMKNEINCVFRGKLALGRRMGELIIIAGGLDE